MPPSNPPARSYVQQLADAEQHELQQERFVRRRLAHAPPAASDLTARPSGPASTTQQAVPPSDAATEVAAGVARLVDAMARHTS